MNLRQFPRPRGDTRLGLHDSPDWQIGYLHQVRHRLKDMGITWLKLFLGNNEPLENGRVSDLATMGFTLLVRLAVSDQFTNRGKYFTLHEPRCVFPRDIVEAMVQEGIPYIELGNEAELTLEWDDHDLAQSKYPDRVVELIDRVIDFERENTAIILDAGGIPVHTNIGLYFDQNHLMTLAMFLQRAEERGVLDEIYPPGRLAVQGIHNRPLNRPPRYPYDREEGFRDWPEPQYTWFNDRAYCYEARQMALSILDYFLPGRNVPIMSTEQGYEIGWMQDPRYPPVQTKEDHARLNVELVRHYHATGGMRELAIFFWHAHRPAPIVFHEQSWFDNEVEGGDLPVVQQFVEANWPPVGDQLFEEEDTVAIWPELPRTSEWYPLRDFAGVQWIVIHHDAYPNHLAEQLVTLEQQVEYCHRIARMHLNKYPPYGGHPYHLVVFPNGRVLMTAPLDRATFHCGVLESNPGAIPGLDENKVAVAVCFVGTYTDNLPTPEALHAGKKVITDLQRGMPNFEKVLGHREVPGAKTICPGDPLIEWVHEQFDTSDPAARVTQLEAYLDRIGGVITEYKGGT